MLCFLHELSTKSQVNNLLGTHFEHAGRQSMLPQPPSFRNSLLLHSCQVFCPVVLLLIMSAPCNPHHLGQINNQECKGFDSWREANLELRQLRVQLKSIPKDHPQLSPLLTDPTSIIEEESIHGSHLTYITNTSS